jgi:biotin carboxyl carrier protein
LSFTFKISGKKMPSTASQTWTFTQRPGGWVIAQPASGAARKMRMMFWEGKNRFTASSRGVLWFGELTQDRHSLSSAGQSTDADLIAQFPGKVRRVLVQPGAKVAEGDSLLLVEAMKMEFAIRAPFSGKVTRVLVKEGQQLSPGDRFLDLEEEGKG